MKDAKGHGSDGKSGSVMSGHGPTTNLWPDVSGMYAHVGDKYNGPAHGSGVSQVGSGPLARWSSAGGKWTAELHPVDGGYRLSEKKNGNEVGASFRPSADNSKTGYTGLHNDSEAISHYENHVRNSFDVGMKKVL